MTRVRQLRPSSIEDDYPGQAPVPGRKRAAMEGTYDERGLQSLFGYGRAAHMRSGGICELCGCGAGPDIDFDLWRQFTIEHLIGAGQGGYPDGIRLAVERRFPHLGEMERRELVSRIHEYNIVTACQFCNSTTSRDRAPFTMEEAIAELPSDPEDALVVLSDKLLEVLEVKRSKVRWKMQSVYRGFRETIRPELLERRRQDPRLQEGRDLSTLEAPPVPDPSTARFGEPS